MSEKPGVCPVEKAAKLDHSFRKLIQNPMKILKPYIKPGMKVLDLGCGPGYFTRDIARMLNGSGKVIAADLQQGMLDKLHEKIKGSVLAEGIEFHKCHEDKIGYPEKVDFILAFYVVHEVPDHDSFFNEMISILKPEGSILIVEPRFHVNKASFMAMTERLGAHGLKIADRPKIFFSRSVLLNKETD
jgi:ubiquinone/menaquinone biosynthesis C-methylase UbiE